MWGKKGVSREGNEEQGLGIGEHCYYTVTFPCRILVYSFVTGKQMSRKRANEKSEGWVTKALLTHCASNLFWCHLCLCSLSVAGDSDLFLLDSCLRYVRRILSLSWGEPIIEYSHSSNDRLWILPVIIFAVIGWFSVLTTLKVETFTGPSPIDKLVVNNSWEGQILQWGALHAGQRASTMRH